MSHEQETGELSTMSAWAVHWHSSPFCFQHCATYFSYWTRPLRNPSPPRNSVLKTFKTQLFLLYPHYIHHTHVKFMPYISQGLCYCQISIIHTLKFINLLLRSVWWRSGFCIHYLLYIYSSKEKADHKRESTTHKLCSEWTGKGQRSFNTAICKARQHSQTGRKRN